MTTMPDQTYVYEAIINRVIDGDTLDVTIDMGLHIARRERIRLLGIDCPEMNTGQAGMAAKEFAAEWCSGETLRIQTHKSDSFGRWLGNVWRISDGANLSQDLLDCGKAVPFSAR